MIELFDRLLSIHPKAERRTMFGCPTGFANGNLFLGLHEDRFFIRLADDERAAFIEQFGATFFAPIPGRKSRQTLVVPARVAAQPALLRHWCEKAVAYALSLPPKKPKKPKKPGPAARKKQAGAKLGAKRARRGSRA
jgi:TfoX/Sxy family transcriptional regulator of competence genes